MTDHIQINDVAPCVHYDADGAQTAFTFPFAVFKAADLEAWLDRDRVQGGFSVTGVGASSGGAVVFALPPAQGVRVTLRRHMTLERISDFQTDGIIRAKTLNDELDYQVAGLQQMADDLSRCVRRPFTSASTADLTLPEPQAGRGIKWNATASGLVNSDNDVDTAVNAATTKAAEAVASAASAAGAATTATTRATEATASAATASGAATTAATRATEAAASAAGAAGSATTATTRAAEAATSAATASGAATTATTRAGEAAVSAATASGAANTATTKAAEATVSAAAAAGSAGTATAQAAIATAAAGNTVRGLAAERAPANWLLGEGAYLSLAEIGAGLRAAGLMAGTRQTVLSGVTGAGQPAFLAVGGGLAVNLSATAAPLVLSAARGFTATGPADVVAVLATDTAAAWSGLAASSTCYLYIDLGNPAAPVCGFSTLAPVYGYAAPSAPATGQHWYDIGAARMSVWTGTAWSEAVRVFVGECVTAAAAVSGVTAYALRGHALVAAAGAAGSTAGLAHNLGVIPGRQRFVWSCLTAQAGYAVGDEIAVECLLSTSGSYAVVYTTSAGRLVSSAAMNYGSVQVAHKTTNALTALTNANWQLKLYAERGF